MEEFGKFHSSWKTVEVEIVPFIFLGSLAKEEKRHFKAGSNWRAEIKQSAFIEILNVIPGFE